MIYTTRSGATQHPEEMLDFLMSRIINTSGVFDVSAGQLEVLEEDTPGMGVKVAPGYAFLVNSDDSKTFPIRITSDETVEIGDNSSGNSRIDAVILYVNLGASANAQATNVAQIAVIPGTPAGSPNAPSDGDISAAIGASNPFIRLGNVTVESGAIQIEDADIADTRPIPNVSAVNGEVQLNNPEGGFGVIIDGGGGVITTGIKMDIEIPYDCEITEVTALADASGSIVVDIWNDTYGNYPPTDADSITASAPVTISAATKSQDSTLTGWDKSLTKGDVLRFNVDSISTIKRLGLFLKVNKT